LANPAALFGIEVSAGAELLPFGGIPFEGVSLVQNLQLLAAAFTEVFS
jgi:hypothetical protein